MSFLDKINKSKGKSKSLFIEKISKKNEKTILDEILPLMKLEKKMKGRRR